MNKEELIKNYLQKPIEIGDIVNYEIKWVSNEKVKVKGKKELQEKEISNVYNGKAKVVDENLNSYLLHEIHFASNFPSFILRDYNNKTITVLKEFCTLNINHIGYKPNFASDIKINEVQQDIEGLLWKVRSREKEFKELNWNPIFNIGDSVVHYQRDFCWTLQDKQLLIESVYNQISIGRFIFRTRGVDYAMKYSKNKLINGCYLDIVDGKQRLNALINFVNNKFPDLKGYYYKDFSNNAKKEFNNYRNLTVAELSENTTDNEVKEIFLKTNFTGVQMSQEHLEFVKSITINNDNK